MIFDNVFIVRIEGLDARVVEGLARCVAGFEVFDAAVQPIGCLLLSFRCHVLSSPLVKPRRELVVKMKGDFPMGLSCPLECHTLVQIVFTVNNVD